MPFKDPLRKKAYQRDWIARNRDRHRQLSREGMKRWRTEHPEVHAARRDAYEALNPGRARAWRLKYQATHPDVRRAIRQRRRARLVGSAGHFTTAEWLGLVSSHGGHCAYCGLLRKLVPDHRLALSRSGANTIDNTLPACARCNAEKGVLTEEEFRAKLRERTG